MGKMKNHRTRATKVRTITGRNIRAMVFLGLFLLFGSCLVAGQWLYRRNLDVYTEHTYSYAQLLADNISGIAPTKFLETEEKDAEYFDIRYLLMTAAIFETEFKDFYLVIPTEDDLIYISEIYHNTDDTDEEFSRQQAGFLEHRPYQPGEKEAMMEVLSREGEALHERKLYMSIRRLHDERLATALVSIHAMEGEAAALIGVDISMSAVWHALLTMYLRLAMAIAGITSIGIILYYRRLNRNLIQPITMLKKETDELVTRLDSDEPFESGVDTGDELEELAHSIEEMDRNLKRYIRENTAITAEREHLATELGLAMRIQADMLPSIFPPFPERNEFDVYAIMDPAKEVGGDFYDFFFIDDDLLALVIADVSGKGIPAALFMMMVKIMVQNCLHAGLEPAQAMEQVNTLICENNKENMFVTVWVGILDIRTGRLRAVNAGNEYPILRCPGGAFELVKDRHGMAAGAMEDVRYREYEMLLEPGSVLFVYSDGLPEATNIANEAFEKDRILSALNEVDGTEPEKFVKNVQRRVDEFVGEAPQFDDLTMMCLHFYKRVGMENEANEEE